MKTYQAIAFLHKVCRKLRMGQFGNRIIYLLNQTLNRPSNKIKKITDYNAFLNSIHKDPHTSAICKNQIVTPTCDLQIIMPVYNTGQFLRDSIESVLSQVTKYKFHLVIINDGSTDNSGDILAEYSSDNRVTIITQKNKGFSGARNTGLKRLFGKYITFIDSDDLFAPDSITNWLDAAYKYNADVVEGSFQRRTPDGKHFGGIKWDNEMIGCTTKMQGYAWLKIYKAELWQNVCFPGKYWYEDTIICGLLLPMVNTYVQIPNFVYYYTVNRNSISFNTRGKNKSIDNLYITASILRDAEELDLIKNNFEYYLTFFIFQTHTNWDRTYLLGPDVEYAIFMESYNLLNKYFQKEILPKNIPSKIVKALRAKDFNSYRLSNLLDF